MSNSRYRAERRALEHNAIVSDRYGQLRVLAQWALLMRDKPDGWVEQAGKLRDLLYLPRVGVGIVDAEFFLTD